MPQETPTYFQELWVSLRPADFVDMLVVAIFAYTVVSWFRRSRSRFVMVGFVLLALMYLAARILDMYLTLFLFQAGITVALVALVIIFQEEIRRGFERLATGQLFAVKERQWGSVALIDTIVEGCSALANGRIGALIVLKAKEPLERHLTGGVRLDGRVSEALLYSIFDPGSAGHDGAVLIEDGRVSRFGVHLPLSTNVGGHEKFGTRHTAALGMSERSDALVVVVSEERGAISVAQGGILETLQGAADLKKRLQGFSVFTHPEQSAGFWRRLLTHDVGAKALSVAIAVGAWLIVFGYQREVVARTFEVPVVFRNVPTGWMFENPKPHEIRVTVSGSNRAFGFLDPEQLTVSLDVASPTPGWQTEELNESDLSLPGDLTVENLDVESVRFEAYPTATVEAPVKPQLEGSVRPSLRLKQVSVQPEQVELVVRKRDEGKIDVVPTEPIDLSKLDESKLISVALQLPKNARLKAGYPATATVTIQIVSAPSQAKESKTKSE